MMEYYNLIKGFAFTGDVGIWTYWIPMALCAIGYTFKTFKQIQLIKAFHKDRNAVTWVQDLTVGTVLWRIILTVTPIANVLALSFSLASDMLSQVFSWIGRVLEFRLVKKDT